MSPTGQLGLARIQTRAASTGGPRQAVLTNYATQPPVTKEASNSVAQDMLAKSPFKKARLMTKKLRE